MKKAESPRRVRRRARLVLLLSECGGAAQVARETGTPKTYISAIVNGTRGLGDKLAAKFEHEYDKLLTPEERKENEALLWGKIMMAEKKNGTDGP